MESTKKKFCPYVGAAKVWGPQHMTVEEGIEGGLGFLAVRCGLGPWGPGGQASEKLYLNARHKLR